MDRPRDFEDIAALESLAEEKDEREEPLHE